MRYAIVIEKAENNYGAYVPDLPGCVTTGKTLEATEQEIREAIEFPFARTFAKTAYPCRSPQAMLITWKWPLEACQNPMREPSKKTPKKLFK